MVPGGAGGCPATDPAHDQRRKPNGATVRFLVDGVAVPADAKAYQRIVLLFNGDDPDAVDTARLRWSDAKKQGFDLTYWQSDEHGRWQRKA